jgi:hypothetical protein
VLAHAYFAGHIFQVILKGFPKVKFLSAFLDLGLFSYMDLAEVIIIAWGLLVFRDLGLDL